MGSSRALGVRAGRLARSSFPEGEVVGPVYGIDSCDQTRLGLLGTI